MTRTLKNEIGYVVACVSEFAHRHSLSIPDAFEYLYRFGGIDFLKENYEIEHQLSFEDAMEDLQIICHKNGGTI